MSITPKKLTQQGFTIVELLIVIVIIGILAALVFVQFNNTQSKARDAERKADLRQISGKLAEFNAEEGSYPADTAAVQALDGIPDEAFVDPSTNAVYTYTATPDDCEPGTGAPCTGFTIVATLENEENGSTTYTVSSD